MKISFPANNFLIILLSILSDGCERHYEVPVPGKDVFDFIVTDSQRLYINESRGLQYEITDPVPVLHHNGNTFSIDRFEIRGDNTLNFTRKGFGVNLKQRMSFYDSEKQEFTEIEEFKLLSMVYDYTYIENSIATALFEEAGIWPVYSFFTEVRLSDHTQGLYFLIEDPFEYFMEKEDAAFVLRRGYDHVKKSYSISPAAQQQFDFYSDRFRNIYLNLPLYSGRQMLDTLAAYIDLEQYFTKLSVDLLVKNGDYTDEVIFYTKIKNGKEIFGVFPWDLDDIFADQPHEIGNDWGTGTVFGARAYYSMDDVVADVGTVLLYSIEDDLDYKIAKDSVLYQAYLKTLRTVMEKIDLAVIDRIFNDTYSQIGAFYSNDAIIQQSQFDVNETDYNLFVANLAEKREMMRERRNWIIQELDAQQNR